ncbi:MAG TPA: hypothetical protein VH834_18090 [Solirubrobacteraceae bacterium]|jgi:hypothetical protein
MTRALWRSGARFAEYAEAVGARTEQMMAAVETPAGAALVLYALGEGPEATVVRSTLRRDEGGILRVQHEEEVGTVGGFTARVEGLMLEYREEER